MSERAPPSRRPARAARGRSRTRSTSPITTRNGACRNTTTARSTRSSMLDGFQAGLSWITILRKRDNFRRAFDGFEPEKIARYTPKKIERLMQDAGIVRNRAKIEGAVSSARAYLDDDGEGSGLLDAAVGLSRRQAEAQQFPRPPSRCRRKPSSRKKMSKELIGARLQVRRPDHRLCLHAGGRHGQRPSGDLPPSRGGARSSQRKR